MKKAFAFIFVLILMLCSCASAETPQEIIPEDANYALHIAGEESLKNATSRLTFAVEKTFITLPEEYEVLEKNRYEIPGLNTIISDWDSYIRAYLSEQCSYIHSDLISYMSLLKFEDPVRMVSSSNSSVSSQFVRLHNDDVYRLFANIVKNADYELIEKALKQYNSYIASINFLYGSNKPYLDSEKIKTYFTDSLASTFTSLLKTSEELYRTTPDPYKDRTAAVVFAVE